MAYIPLSVREGAFNEGGPTPSHRGKVRDTYSLAEFGYPDLLLVWVSNRISIFDFILGMLIPGKGAILNLISTFWKLYLKKNFRIETDLVAWGERIDTYLPPQLRGNKDLWARATIVRKQTMVTNELIVREYLTGTGYKDYVATSEVCGHKLPPGLYDGAKLPYEIFTPSTKADIGHDDNVNRDTVVAKWGPGIETAVLTIFKVISNILKSANLVLADTKLEFGYVEAKQMFVVADEVGTSDSSRIWDAEDTKKAAALKVPAQGFDKQFMREIGKSFEINNSKKYNPAVESDCIKVGNLEFPSEAIKKTTVLYLELAKRLSNEIEKLGDPALTKMLEAVLVQGWKSAEVTVVE